MSERTKRELRAFGWRTVGFFAGAALLIFGPLLWTTLTEIQTTGRVDRLERQRHHDHRAIAEIEAAIPVGGGDALQPSNPGGQQPSPGQPGGGQGEGPTGPTGGNPPTEAPDTAAPEGEGETPPSAAGNTLEVPLPIAPGVSVCVHPLLGLNCP